MRVSPVVLALPALAAAAEQVPLLDQLKGFFNKATAAISSSVPSVPSAAAPIIENPIDSGAAAIAQLSVDRVTVDNYKQIIAPSGAASGPEPFLLFVTGGNKTCFGLCAHAETEFNKSVALISAASNPPHLGLLNCEAEPVLCNAWAVGPPSVLYMQLPQPLADQSKPATTVYNIPLNRTSVTAAEIAALHTETKFSENAPYEGYFHPFDSQLAKLGLDIPFGYGVYYFSLIPSWAMMVGISFFTRTFMSKRMPQGGAPRPAGAAPAPAQ